MPEILVKVCSGLPIVLVAALGGAAAYLFVNRKKLN